MTPDSDAESLADLFSINIYENECQTGKSPDKHHYLFTNSDTKIFSLSGYMYIYLDWDKFSLGPNDMKNIQIWLIILMTEKTYISNEIVS